MFTKPDTWNGGFYELAIEVTADPDTDKLFAVYQALTSFPALAGPYRRRDEDPEVQNRVLPSRNFVERGGIHTYWIATIDSKEVACSVTTVREDSGPDWLDVNLPMGGLSNQFPVGGFPFEVVSEMQDGRWLNVLDQWLTMLGQHIFTHVPYLLGLVGFEVSGHAYAHGLNLNGVPDERSMTYLINRNDQLVIFPRTSPQ